MILRDDSTMFTHSSYFTPYIIQGPHRQRMPRSVFRKNAIQPGHVFFKRYEVIKRVGGGGMGNVYQARDVRLANRFCAIKEMIDLYSDPEEHERTIKEFEREASLLATLRHPSIPMIYDYFRESDKYYLVMEYIDGLDLNQYMKRLGTRMPEPQVLHIGIRICDVLHYLHTHVPPVIYRDLKPSNIMLSRNDRVVLVDFGIARFLTAGLTDITTIGTMGFVPPEVYEEKIEPASDIYSLGATLFYFLTAVSPQTKPIMIFDFTKNPLPREYNPEISLDTEAALLRCVAYNTSNRFPSSYALKKELERIASAQIDDAPPPRTQSSMLDCLDHKVQERQLAGVPCSPHATNPGTPISEFDRLRQEFEEEFKDFIPPGKSLTQTESQRGIDIYCISCYQLLSESDHVCPHCGTGQPDSPFIRVPRAVLKLEGAYQAFQLTRDINIIGRRDPERHCFPEIDLTPYDSGKHISRLHARILKLKGEFYIEDMKSKNKIVINGRYRLTPGVTHKLADGDQLRIGNLVFYFSREP